MPAQKSRADSLREFLTGASSDGGAQSSSILSLGNYRSSTEAVSLGIAIADALSGVSVLYAGGSNPVGDGLLTAVDSNTLTWQPFGAVLPGQPANFNGTETRIVEAKDNPSQYLRVTGTTPFTPGQSVITLSYLYNNIFGLDDISIANASAGIVEYSATMVRNESPGTVQLFQRWLSSLGTAQVSDGVVLGGSGSGTITTSGTLSDWPETGWCQVRNSGGTLKEVVYYSSRTNTTLTIPSTGRALLGTTATAGAVTDTITPVPGVAIGIDSAGAQAFGTSIQTIASITTPPTGVTWNLGIAQATGLQIGSLLTNEQVGIWIKRQIPAGAIATPQALTKFLDSFIAY